MSYTLGAGEFSLPDDIKHMIALGFAEADKDITQAGKSDPSKSPLENCAEHFRTMLELVVPIIFRTAENEPLAARRQAFGLSVMLTAQMQRWVDHFEAQGYGPEKLAMSSGSLGQFPCFCLAARDATAPQISLGTQRDNYQIIRSGGMVRHLQNLATAILVTTDGCCENFLLLERERPHVQPIIDALAKIAPNLPPLWALPVQVAPEAQTSPYRHPTSIRGASAYGQQLG